MLLSNLDVLNALLAASADPANPTAFYYSSADHYDALGRGEKIVGQLIVDTSSLPTSGTKDVVVRMERSNDGKVWDAPADGVVILSLDPSTTFPTSKFFDTSTMEEGGIALGAKVRFRAASGMDNTAIRVIASVRGEQGR